MGYPKDLDEYNEDELARELQRRDRVRARGHCDYCDRLPSAPPCKFPWRHSDPRIDSKEGE